jgi:hypothetical protein
MSDVESQSEKPSQKRARAEGHGREEEFQPQDEQSEQRENAYTGKQEHLHKAAMTRNVLFEFGNEEHAKASPLEIHGNCASV